ncbi:MAG: hypothetical protein N2323_06730 [candidate division WOR-3 bacterium]|nr:hypothetical protein [candidate division WOR-3 bacterium]
MIILFFLLNSNNLKVNCQEDSLKKIVYKDNWFGEDKLFHFSVSSLLIGSTYHLLKCRLKKDNKLSTYFSLTGTFFLGISKEVYDKKIKKEIFSYKDLIYDLLGILFGYFLFIH